jgi:hypothetical protein
MALRKPIPIMLIAFLAIGVLFLPLAESSSAQTLPVLALTVFIIGLMATDSLPEYQVSALYFGLALAFQVAPAGVVLSSFRSSAFWLIAGGVVLGIAAIKTGLGRRIAEVFVRCKLMWCEPVEARVQASKCRDRPGQSFPRNLQRVSSGCGRPRRRPRVRRPAGRRRWPGPCLSET